MFSSSRIAVFLLACLPTTTVLFGSCSSSENSQASGTDGAAGQPNVNAASLTLDPALSSWEANTESDPLTINVTAVQGDGNTDTFHAESSDEDVVAVVSATTSITLTAVGEGSATVSIVSDSDPQVQRSIQVAVAPAYEDSEATYAALDTLTEPAAGESEAYIDTRIRLTFDDVPTLGSRGSIRIFRADDDSLVDTVRVGAETDAIGLEAGTNAGRVRVVNTTPISIDGNMVTVSLHHGVLEYDTEYYVGVSSEALDGTLDGQAFEGIGSAAGWTFTTRAAAPEGADVSVDDDGTSADFRTVQGALSYLMATQDVDTPATVSVSEGTYRELLFLRSKNNVTIAGESRDGVVIHYENYEGLNGGTGSSTDAAQGTPGGGRSLFLVEQSDLLTLDTLTLHNTHARSGTGDQAETIYFNSPGGRLIAKNATFLSEQDTVQLKGWSWFYQSLIAGTTDFIWGGNRVSLFEDSEIRMVGDPRSSGPSGGYLVQARTAFVGDKGFVFLNSLLSHGPGASGTEVATGDAAKSYLARSGGNASYFDNVSYINCRMDTHIPLVGWLEQPAPNPTTGSVDSGWKEYGSTDLEGNPLDLSGRAASARTLTTEEYEAGFASREIIFAEFGNGAGWNPEP